MMARPFFEFTDNLWMGLYETLENHAVEVKLANPNNQSKSTGKHEDRQAWIQAICSTHMT
jgi:hypothetical protein